MRTVFFLGLLACSLATDAAGEAYLEERAKDQNVVKLPSGLLYEVVKKGHGSKHPGHSTRCKVHYSGTLIDGTKFDSSYDRGQPATFAPNQVIAGWTEALQKMVEGDVWNLFIPSDLAYGERGRPPKIPGQAALVFKVELVEIL
eukprot:TRINITY_DN32878_c0_g1_i1.p1 TRINITY_DN32878_c0_g1~~TRINITY_DN32878_c0_g1_i1.p1  ORF type:complete len:144 (+),score=25.46 TRINITY_DN32878_c0_g1_i1:87-518(+)